MMQGACGRPDPAKCKAGLHDWTPENVRQYPSGRPHCYPCRRIREKRKHLATYRPRRRRQIDNVKAFEDYGDLRELGFTHEEVLAKLDWSPDAFRLAVKRRPALAASHGVHVDGVSASRDWGGA